MPANRVSAINGKTGEDYVCAYLTQHGYTVLTRNFHSRFGEIDIIAQKEPYLVFTEVKCRAEKAQVHPFEAITRDKQKKILLTAQYYLSLAQHKSMQLQPRFDAAAVTVRGDGTVLQCEYLPNAFGM